jgi:hypothetical protein
LASLSVDVSLGVCTGADEVHILKRRLGSSQRVVNLTTRNGEDITLEAGILRPILRARHGSSLFGVGRFGGPVPQAPCP